MARTLLLTLAAVLLFAPASAHAACPEVVSVTALRLMMRQAEEAYRALDIEAFRSSLDSAATQLPCIDERLGAPDIARYHRLQGLLASVVGDTARAQQAFLAARSLEPGFRLPLDMVPAEHPTRLEYAALPLDSVVWEPLPPPRQGRLFIDGTEQLQRPTNRPAVAQRLDEADRIVDGSYLWPGAALAYPTAATASSLRHRSRGLSIGAGGAAVASGVLAVVAARSRAAYDAESGSVEQLDALRARTNLTGGLSLGTGAVALGLGTAAVVAWEW